MIAIASILTCVLFAFVVMATCDILSRVWNGYPVTIEDIISHLCTIAILFILAYLILIFK